MPESWEEQKARLERIVEVGGPIGQSDRAAIAAVLAELSRVKEELIQISMFAPDHGGIGGTVLEQVKAMAEKAEAQVGELKSRVGELQAAVERCRDGREKQFQKLARLSRDWQEAEAQLAKARRLLEWCIGRNSKGDFAKLGHDIRAFLSAQESKEKA